MENCRIKAFRLFMGISTFLLVLTSCNDDKKKEVDFESLRPKAKTSTAPKVQDSDTTERFLSRLQVDSIQLFFEGFEPDETPHFLDRFSFTKNTKLADGIDRNSDRWIFNKGAFATSFGQWFFKDSLAKKSALYNWLDHFGKDKKSVSLYTRMRLSNENLLILINQKSILSVASSAPIESKKWEAYQRQMHPKDTMMLKIFQRKGNKCDWYKKSGNFTFVKIAI